MAPTWRLWEPFWLQVRDLGGHLGSKLGSVGHLGSKLGVLKTILAPCWGVLRPSWLQIGRSWGHVGSKLGDFGFKFGFFGSKLRVKWAVTLHFVSIAKIIEKSMIFIVFFKVFEGSEGSKLAPKSSKLGVLGPSWLQVGGSVGHLGINLRVLEAIWGVKVETFEKPRVFQDSGGGGGGVWYQLVWVVAGGFCPRGVARGLSY